MPSTISSSQKVRFARMKFSLLAYFFTVALFLWLDGCCCDDDASSYGNQSTTLSGGNYDYDIVASCPLSCRPPASVLRQNAQRIGEDSVRVFYLIIVHDEQSMLDAVPLFRAIRDPRNIIAIHVDVKARHLLQRNETDSKPVLIREIQDCPCGSPVRINAVHDVKWSHWSMNLPTFWGMEMAVKEFPDQWDAFINLAGNTLPVYTTDTIATMLNDLPYNFVTSSSCETGLLPTNVYEFPSFWHKRRHYTLDDTVPDPVFEFTDTDGTSRNTTIQIHFGSQWVILQHHFVHWLVNEMGRPDSLATLLADHLRETGRLMTDETFLSSLIMHIDPSLASLPRTNENDILLWNNGTPSGIRDVRYERLDEHVPSAFGHFWTQQRYDVPETSSAEQPRPWGPYYLGVYDLANIRESGALFVRKISRDIDANMLHLLPVKSRADIPSIQWPSEVSLTPKPNWSEKVRQLYETVKAMDEEEDTESDDGEL